MGRKGNHVSIKIITRIIVQTMDCAVPLCHLIFSYVRCGGMSKLGWMRCVGKLGWRSASHKSFPSQGSQFRYHILQKTGARNIKSFGTT